MPLTRLNDDYLERDGVRFLMKNEDGAAVAESARKTHTFTISTSGVDRMGDTVNVNGWKLDGYRRNPVVLWGHNSDLLPVGKALHVRTQNGRLKAEVDFANTPMGNRVAGLVEQGVLRAASVGFRPLKYELANDRARPFGINFLEQELLEFSVVAIPANPEALLTDGKSYADDQKRRRRERELEVIKIRAAC